jgi:hypothetical protein
LKTTSKPSNRVDLLALYLVGRGSSPFLDECTHRCDYPSEMLEKFQSATLQQDFPAVAKLYDKFMLFNRDQQGILAEVAFRNVPLFDAVCNWIKENDANENNETGVDWRAKWLPGCDVGEVAGIDQSQGLSCRDCSAGFYNADIGATACTQCGLGASNSHLLETAAARSCSCSGRFMVCTGTYQSNDHSAECIKCSATGDRYQDSPGSSVCKDCPSSTRLKSGSDNLGGKKQDCVCAPLPGLSWQDPPGHGLPARAPEQSVVARSLSSGARRRTTCLPRHP